MLSTKGEITMGSVSGPGTTNHIIAILKANGIDPDAICGNGQTAFDFLEGCIGSAIDEIEENDFNNDEEEDFDDED
jgi:hypothetical protein